MPSEEQPDLLAQILGPVDSRLRLALDFARARLGHAASKGALLESELRRILADHLPRGLRVGQGEVIDTHGTRTGQVDLLVTNEYQPFRWATDEPGIHIIEGVSAAGELKAVLGTTELSDVIAKGTRFKALRYRAHAGATVYGRHESDLARFYEAPPFVAIGVESTLSPQTALDRLAQVELVPSPDDQGAPQHPVDAVFLLDRGVALNLGDGKGQLKFAGPDGDPVAGWIFYESTTVLADMLLWLYQVTPRFSLASGLPINHYAPRATPRSFWRPTPSS